MTPLLSTSRWSARRRRIRARRSTARNRPSDGLPRRASCPWQSCSNDDRPPVRSDIAITFAKADDRRVSVDRRHRRLSRRAALRRREIGTWRRSSTPAVVMRSVPDRMAATAALVTVMISPIKPSERLNIRRAIGSFDRSEIRAGPHSTRHAG